MASYRVVIDLTMDATDIEDACTKLAQHFTDVANGTSGEVVFDYGATTSIAPVDDPGWT